MDIGLAGMNGIDTTRQVLAAYPQLKVIALSTHADPIFVTDMLKAGASAYVTKNEGGQELARAIEEASQGRIYRSPAAMPPMQDGSPEAPALAVREIQVLRLVATGLSSPQIATELNIAVGTVEVHRRNIMRKLNLHSAVELTRYAIKRNLLGE
jgi:two-component system NarL family response regulator